MPSQNLKLSHPQVSIATEIVSTATSNTGMSTATTIMMMGLIKSDSMQTEDTMLWRCAWRKKTNNVMRNRKRYFAAKKFAMVVQVRVAQTTTWLVNFQSLLTRKRPKGQRNVCDIMFNFYVSASQYQGSCLTSKSQYQKWPEELRRYAPTKV